MTNKKSLKIKYLLVVVLLLIAVCSAFKLGTVFADEKTDTQEAIQQKYESMLEAVDGEPYNGKDVLDSYKDKADYLLSKVGSVGFDGSYESVKNDFFAECEVLTGIVDEGKKLTDYVNNLYSGNYEKFYWGKIEKIESDTLELFDMTELRNDGNLTVDYVKGEVDSAIEEINEIKQRGDAEEITEYREQAKLFMEQRLTLCEYSNVYSDEVIKNMKDDFDVSFGDLKSASDRDEIDSVKGQFVSKLKAYKTVVQETANDLNEHLNGDSDIKFSIKSVEVALEVYENIISNENGVENTKYVGDTEEEKEELFEQFKAEFIDDVAKVIESDYRYLLTYYGKEKSKSLENDYEKIKDHYSSNNYSDIKGKLAELGKEIKACSDSTAVDNAISSAESFIKSVPENVRTIRTKSGKYNVEIVADKEYAFSPDAYVVATDYTYYAVKKNVNRLLKKVDTGDKNKKYAVKYYVNISVIDEDNKNITKLDGVTFTVKIYNDTITNSLKDDKLLKVVYYYNGEMEGFDSESKNLEDKFPSSIENEGEYLMFTTTHFSPFAICGTGSLADTLGFKDGPLFKNPFFYVAIILLVIILYLLAVLLTKIWKYKVVFKTNGGSKVKTVKAKKNEPFIMPSVPTRAGYMFGGWFKDKACKNRFVLYKITRRKNIKVYAKWIKLPETAPSVTLDDLYKALRTAFDDYQKVGFGVGLSKREEIGRIIISNDKVNVYLKGDLEKYQQMGYGVSLANVDELKETPMKITVKDEEQLYKVLELIDLVMAENGFSAKDGEVQDFAEISEEERSNGYVFSVENEVEATTMKDFFELMRMEAKSYVLMGDSGTPRDMNGKYIVKAKLSEDKIDLYLPYDNGEAEDVSADATYKDVPAHYEISDKETLIKALKVMAESMASIGMKKYPRNASLMKQSGEVSNAFGYRIRFN